MQPVSFASKIPEHPKGCSGVKSPIYDTTQCRLCWLAAYDKGYRRKWGINQKSNTPALSFEQMYPCIHRGSEKLMVPGCGTCNGQPIAYPCENPHATSTRCLVAGTQAMESNARSKGLLICRDCGWREPETGLEMPVNRFRLMIEQNELPDNWHDFRVARHAMLDFMRETINHLPPFPQKNISGRGIVIAAGGNRYFRLAFATVMALRKLGCTLPVQVWYLGSKEMDRLCLKVCEDFGIEAIDATEVASRLIKKPRKLNGWELKPFATYHSRFEEVLFMDADCVPYRDPTYIFDDQAYLELGAMFWPDLQGSSYGVRQDVWKRIGRLEQAFPGFESGQYLINKSRCWKELALTIWFNDYSDYWYKFVYGDKDTFCLAWHAIDTDYAFAPTCNWSHPCILQYDNQGNLLFTHACQGKDAIIRGEVTSGPYLNYDWLNDSAKILRRRINDLTSAGMENTILVKGTPDERINPKSGDPPL